MSRFRVGGHWRARNRDIYKVVRISEETPDYPVIAREISRDTYLSFDLEGHYVDADNPGQYDLIERALVLYVAGPMTGYPDLNFPAFHTKAAELRAAGYVVINPAEINGGDAEIAQAKAMTPEELQAHWQKCMRKDITELCTCDGIAMLDGWTRSKGATLEHHVAKALGLTVFEAVA